MGKDGAEEPECTLVHEDSEHRPTPHHARAAIFKQLLNDFKIARQLPIRNMTAELALFPFAGRGIVIDECVAK